MFEIKVTVDIPALDRLTAKLDAYIAAKGADTKVTLDPPVIPYTAPDMPVPTTTGSTPDANTVPTTTTAPTPAVLTPVVAPAPVTPPTVAPTAAPAFTLMQVAKAGADLITAKPGLQPQLVELLGRFGAQTVKDLPQDRLGEFAAELRALGGKI